jgi:TolA-binding protein
MDCERFDRIVLELLYEELDELTAAAAHRHVVQCGRCRGILAGLRATREVGTLPLVDPPPGLELSILEAEQRVRERLSFRQRFGRAVSVLAGYAMRPQLAMALLLLLAIGSSLVFFRARPGDQSRISVTERGTEENEGNAVAVVAAPSPEQLALPLGPPSAPVRSEPRREATSPGRAAARPAEALALEAGESAGDSAYQMALAALRAGRYREAREQFESVATRGGPDAAQAAFHAAEATKNERGCSEAARLFDQVPFHYPGTGAGYDATFQAAACYESLGELEKARRNYQALLDEPGYAERARTALAQLERLGEPVELAARKQRQQSASGPAAPAKAASPAAEAKPGEPAPQPSDASNSR